ncbi:MAG: hypothetical protein QOE33_473 [Acidobacteriota bacterium]|nr:hypothetical protein [Acidobacteriota bacterium]
MIDFLIRLFLRLQEQFGSKGLLALATTPLVAVLIGRLYEWNAAFDFLLGVAALVVGFLAFDWLSRRVHDVKLQDSNPQAYVLQKQHENVRRLSVNMVKAHGAMLSRRQSSSLYIISGLVLLLTGFGIYCYRNFSAQYLISLAEAPPVPAGYSTPSPITKGRRTEKVAAATPVPISTPTPEKIPPPSVKQVDNNKWRVVLSGPGWFDTGIPVIANDLVRAETEGRDSKFLLKVGAGQWFAGDSALDPNWRGAGAVVGENPRSNLVTDYDFRDTVKLKLDDEGPSKWIVVTVELNGSGAWYIYDPYDSPEHDALHEPAEEWKRQMLERIAWK